MKKFFTILSGLVLAVSLQAQSVYKSGSVTSAVANLLSTSIGIQSIQMVDTSGSANLVSLYDNSTASTNRVRASYTANVVYSTNVVESFTNLAGVAQSFTNTVLHTQAYTVAAATNEAGIVYRITVPANGTVLWTPSPSYDTTFGLTIKAAGALNYVLQYNKLPY